ELMRGPKGSRVRLTVISGDDAQAAAPRIVSLIRDQINLADQEAKAEVIDLPTGKGPSVRLGVIDLPSFYAGRTPAGPRSATVDVARLLAKLKAENVRGVVMDLRHNGGGSLDEAISLTGLFIRKGPVVQTRDQSGRVEVGVDDDGQIAYDGPLVLLTSRMSASATEILAGALQDYGRAVVVGDSSTFGKGTVQSIVGLAPLMDRAGLAHGYDPGALKITISKFYRPSGASTQLRGVVSDIVLPSTTDVPSISEASLKDPLPWDVVPAASYQLVNRVQPYLGVLRENSARRVKTDRAFLSLAKDIDQEAKSLASKAVSLNEEQRRREQTEAKARQVERDRQAQGPEADKPIVHEITLANVDLPGLPPPVIAKSPKAAAEKAAAASETGSVSASDQAILAESLRILSDYVDLWRLTGV
ncbi:MAG TPA: carboxy terminal-processing peptidase, partial [Polyangia bacterium]